MTADELNTPVGTGKPKRRRFTLPALVPRAIAGVLAACLVTFALWAALVDNPFGGEPVVVAPIELHAPAGSKTADATPAAQAKGNAPAQAADAPADKNAPAGGKTVTIIDGSSGKRQDVVVADKKIAEGERVYCVLGSAGRDEDAFDHPNEFVVDRVRPRQHLAFGRGMHTCVGASLARLEARVAFEVLGRRMPSARLAQGSLSCVANATLRIPAGLLIEWDI